MRVRNRQVSVFVIIATLDKMTFCKWYVDNLWITFLKR